MNSNDRSHHSFWVPVLIMLVCLGGLISCISLLFVKVHAISIIDQTTPKIEASEAYLRFFDANIGNQGTNIDEATALLDTAPLFMPTKFTLEAISASTNPSGHAEVEYSFPNYPAEIQLDGSQFAVAARMSIPVTEAVDLGLSKLRETSINFNTLGREQELESLTPVAKRACHIKIVRLETGETWVKNIAEINDSDTRSPLWEPMILFAAIGDLGTEAYPSPANTTGIESLDKKLNLIADQTLEKLDLPSGNYRIVITP